MFLMFLINHPIYDVYMEQSQDNRWAEHMKDAHSRISPYHYSKNPGEEFRKLLNENGFGECIIKEKVEHDTYYEHTLDTLSSKIGLVDRFIAFSSQLPTCEIYFQVLCTP